VTLVKFPYGSSSLIRAGIKGESEPFYFAVRKGVFIGSSRPYLVSKALDRITLNLPSVISTGFRKVEALSGKKVDANLYLNYRLLPAYLERFLKEGTDYEPAKAGQFADWSGLDVILKQDEVRMTGFTVPSDTLNQFLSVFREQQPQPMPALRMLPDNTSAFIFFGAGSPGSWNRRLREFLSVRQDPGESYPELAMLENRESIRLADYILPWTGPEILSVSISRNPDDPVGDDFALISVADPVLADSLMREMGSLSGKRSDSVHFKEYTIRTLHIGNVVPYVWGPFFSRIRGSYYALAGNYLLFGNDEASVKDFLDRLSTGSLLRNRKDFTSFIENFTDQSNLFFYFNHMRPPQNLQGIVRDDLYLSFLPALDSLKKLEQAGIQLINREGNFYTSLYFEYNPNPGERGPLEWQVTLDTVLSGKPQFVRVTRKGSRAVTAADLARQVYLADSSGNVIWKLRLPGLAMGPVRTVFPGNGDSAYFLVNTPTHLCLIRPDGNFATRYPLPLPARATAPLAVTESAAGGDYRVYIPLSDNRVYIARLDGTPVRISFDPKLREEITREVQPVSYGGKDYLFITGKNGRLAVTDRKGRPAIRVPKSLLVCSQGEISVNRTNRKGTFLTTVPAGKVIYIGLSETLSEATFNLFSPAHRFFYSDLNRDGTYEFIFYDQNKLYYYNRFYTLTYSYVFARELTIPPFRIVLPGGRNLIGAVSGTTGELYLFGGSGLIPLEKGIRGDTYFDVGYFNSGKAYFLVTGTGRYLKCYRLPQF
jgi:hypothetical protein